MDAFKWIMSEGGPLICMEKRFAPAWGGILELTVPSDTAANDYERAGEPFGFVQAIAMNEGDGLVFGEGPLDTSFWRSEAGQVYLVQISACDPDVDLDPIMRTFDDTKFANPRATLPFAFATSELALFDSAVDGADAIRESVTFSIVPGRYNIFTIFDQSDPRCWLIVYRFDLVV